MSSKRDIGFVTLVTGYSHEMKLVLKQNNPNVVKYDCKGGDLQVRADVVHYLDFNRDYNNLAKYKKFALQAKAQVDERAKK